MSTANVTRIAVGSSVADASGSRKRTDFRGTHDPPRFHTFRFNRRFYPMTAFNSVLGLAVRTVPPTYAALYSGAWEHPGGQPRPPQLELPF